VHVFTYSVRPGTAAAEWEQVPESIRHRRCRQMMEVAQAGREDFLRQAVGQTYLVLLEGKQGEWIHGFTENYVPVSIPSSQGIPNELMQVHITGIDGDGCKGVSVEG
jgi:tRNA A37 methylthiotransferase MiaB